MSTSIHYDCLTGIRNAIIEIGLTGVTGGNPLAAGQHYVRKLPTINEKMTLPCVLISFAPLPETYDAFTSRIGEDQWGYPCLVNVVIPENQNFETFDADAELSWRQQIRNKFHNRRPTAVITALGSGATLAICVVEPDLVIDPQAFYDRNLLESAMVIRVHTIEAR